MAIEIYPVIHLKSTPQARDQAALAYGLGADGVFLIDHENTETGPLLSAYNVLADRDPRQFVGLNILQIPRAIDAFDALSRWYQKGWLTRLPDALWVDDAADSALEVVAIRDSDPWLASIRYLGGVAFKGTVSFTDNPQCAVEEAERLAPYVDVVTTSGRGTGHAPNVAKIAAMKATISDQPLAVASGISAANIAEYAGLLDMLLVASSVETEPDSGVFDETKLAQLISLAHSL